MSEPKYVSFKQAAASLLPEPRKPSCLSRWHRDGVRIADGSRIRLKAARLGKGYYTTQEWIEQFMLAVAEADQAARQKQQPAPVAVASINAELEAWRNRR